MTASIACQDGWPAVSPDRPIVASAIVVESGHAEGDGVAVDDQSRPVIDVAVEIVGGCPLAVPSSGRRAQLMVDRRCVVVLAVQPVTVALVPDGPSRLFAVAPAMAVAVTLDFVE